MLWSTLTNAVRPDAVLPNSSGDGGGGGGIAATWALFVSVSVSVAVPVVTASGIDEDTVAEFCDVMGDVTDDNDDEMVGDAAVTDGGGSACAVCIRGDALDGNPIVLSAANVTT